MPPRVFWDTSLTVGGLTISNDTLLQRSIVEAGNNHRLARFFEKCRPGAMVKLGFIGGSITRGAKASDTAHAYPYRLGRFLSQTFSGTAFSVINAGVGSTGSRFGCSRVKADLLDSVPDLIVVEFAVNDESNDTAWFPETLEGLIRRCLAYSPSVPVILFQTLARNGDSSVHKAQERIARHYAIPVVGYRSAVWLPLSEGRLAWESLAADDVHPNDSGHAVCGYLLYNFLRSGYSELESARDPAFGIPAPLYGDRYEHAGILGPSDTMVSAEPSSAWAISTDGKGASGFSSTESGQVLVLGSKAREVTFLFRYAGNLHARIAVKIDGADRDTISNYFAEDWGGGYLKAARLFKDAARADHTIEIANLDGGLFELPYVLFAP